MLAGGCSTIENSREQKAELMHEYSTGEYNSAVSTVKDKASSSDGTGDELMWRLEEGTILFEAGDYKKSLDTFDRAQYIINSYNDRAEINARAVGAEIASAFTNPNAVPYKGFTYGKILLNIYKALDYFALGDSQDACVELRIAYQKQFTAAQEFNKRLEHYKEEVSESNQKANTDVNFDGLLENPKISESYNEIVEKSNKNYGNLVNPFVTFMTGIGYLSESDFQNAYISFKNLTMMVPENKLIEEDFVTIALDAGYNQPSFLENIKPLNYPLNKNILFVIYAGGLAPALKEEKIQLVLPFVGYTGFAYPTLQYFPLELSNVEVSYDGKKYVTTTVSDMDAVVSQEYKQLLPLIITRIAISTITKELASAAAVEAAYQVGKAAGDTSNTTAMLGGNLSGLAAMAITGIYKYTFNTADTRCWQTLPKIYQITQIPIVKKGKIMVNSQKQYTNTVDSFEIEPDGKMYILYLRAPKDRITDAKLFQF